MVRGGLEETPRSEVDASLRDLNSGSNRLPWTNIILYGTSVNGQRVERHQREHLHLLEVVRGPGDQARRAELADLDHVVLAGIRGLVAGRSIRITVAPRSERMVAASGTGPIAASSKTRTPWRGPKPLSVLQSATRLAPISGAGSFRIGGGFA